MEGATGFSSQGISRSPRGSLVHGGAEADPEQDTPQEQPSPALTRKAKGGVESKGGERGSGSDGKAKGPTQGEEKFAEALGAREGKGPESRRPQGRCSSLKIGELRQGGEKPMVPRNAPRAKSAAGSKPRGRRTFAGKSKGGVEVAAAIGSIGGSEHGMTASQRVTEELGRGAFAKQHH